MEALARIQRNIENTSMMWTNKSHPIFESVIGDTLSSRVWFLYVNNSPYKFNPFPSVLLLISQS